MTIHDLPSPALLIDINALERNLKRVQNACSASGVELWPHIKTHKMVPLLRRQLELGAAGATCAKVGEAEAMLPSGVKRIFLAHSLSPHGMASRLRALRGKLDELVLAVTSVPQFGVLERVLEDAQIDVSILLAVNTGLDREGVRDIETAKVLVDKIRANSRMHLAGLYTHEGHSYTQEPENVDAAADAVYAILQKYSEALGGLPLWPGCSVTAERMAKKKNVRAVRPGSYVFGDLSLAVSTGIMEFKDIALTVQATVVDRPESNFALIDAGSKVFSADKSRAGIHATSVDGRGLDLTKFSEEHGFIKGEAADSLQIGDRIRFAPAHVCSVVNLANHIYVIDGENVIDTWTVNARGRSD